MAEPITDEERSASPRSSEVSGDSLENKVCRFEIGPESEESDESDVQPDMSTSSGTPESWISSFCSLLGHEYFAEISEDFIEDDFNLTGLQTQVSMYKEALEVGRDIARISYLRVNRVFADSSAR